MRQFLSLLLLAAAASADQPAVAPAYVAPAQDAQDSYGAPSNAQDSYGAPSNAAPAAAAPDSYGSPASEPVQDSYGSPSSPPVSTGGDSYGSPAAPVQDSYGSPEAAPVQAAPGNQGYYYYYYPVRQNVPEAESEDEGILGGLLSGGLAGLLTTKVLLAVLGIAGFVLVTSLATGLGKRSFSSRALKSLASPYMTQGNLIALLQRVNSAVSAHEE